jgi:hypothetical protein
MPITNLPLFDMPAKINKPILDKAREIKQTLFDPFTFDTKPLKERQCFLYFTQNHPPRIIIQTQFSDKWIIGWHIIGFGEKTPASL